MTDADRAAAILAEIRRRWRNCANDDVPRLLAAVEEALKLHKPVDRGRVMRCCEGCEAIDGEFHPGFCHEWPCPTVEAITAALTGKEAGDGT